MERILGKDNGTVRNVMADGMKAYVAKYQPINFTNGDVITIGTDGKIKMETYVAGKKITKKWGRITLANRQAIIKQLKVNPVFTKFMKDYIDAIKPMIAEFFADTPANRIAVAKYIKVFLSKSSATGLSTQYRTGKIKFGGKLWGKITFAKRVSILKKLVKEDINFVVLTNEAIKKDLDKYLVEGLYEGTKANRNKVAKLLRAYLASGATLKDVSIYAEKVVYTGDMVEVSGTGLKNWGSIKWAERVAILQALKSDANFKAFSNNFLK